MKKVSMLSMIIVLITLAACKKDKTDPEPAAKAKLLGKWQLDSLINETRTLTTTGGTIDSETKMGEAGDSVIFKSNNMLYVYEDASGGNVKENSYPFQFLSEVTISWDGKSYEIRKLTDTELNLYRQELITERGQIEVTDLYLMR